MLHVWWLRPLVQRLQVGVQVKQDLIRLLRRQWVSPLDALDKLGCMSLSQRCGELRRDGVQVVDKWVSRGGKRFKTYTLMGRSRG